MFVTIILTYDNFGEEAVDLTDRCFGDMQQDFETRFKDLTKTLSKESDLSAREEIMTREHMEMSRQAHALALALYRKFVYGEE